MRYEELGVWVVAFGLAIGCSSDEGGDDGGAAGSTSNGGGGSSAGGAGGAPAGPLPVGSPCSGDSECGGYDNPMCQTSLKPLLDLVEDTGDPANDALRDLELPFPGGYCATPMEPPCAADDQCGDGGACWIPFEGVPVETIENLNGLGLPFDVAEFAKAALCLVPCTADSDCREDEGYTCITPLADFAAVINQDYEKKFCAVDVDVSNLVQ